MKQFKFHKLNTLTQAIPLAIAITLLFISYFKILDVEYSKLNKLCKVLAYAIIALHFTQTLWYKHYVSYNKKGITILKPVLLYKKSAKIRKIDFFEFPPT